MTPEEKALLENTYELVKENNTLLRNLKQRARISNILKISYWAIIILVSLGAFYFIQPYVDMLRGLSGNAPKTSSNGAPSYAETLQELLQ